MDFCAPNSYPTSGTSALYSGPALLVPSCTKQSGNLKSSVSDVSLMDATKAKASINGNTKRSHARKLYHKLLDLVHADRHARLLVRLLSSAPPVDLEVGLLCAVRRLVDGLRVRAHKRLEGSPKLLDVVREAELGFEVREDVAQGAVRRRVRQKREEGGVEEGL